LLLLLLLLLVAGCERTSGQTETTGPHLPASEGSEVAMCPFEGLAEAATKGGGGDDENGDRRSSSDRK